MGRPLAALAALGLLAAGLAGCTHEKVADSGYRWAFLSDASEAPRLAYGRPSSDDVILMLSCSPGADSVQISAVGLNGREIVLASDRIESRFPAGKADSALVDIGLLEARGRMSAPALTGFQHTGDLTILTNGERHNLHARREDEGPVKAFFRSCAAA
ncbi:hypothetical protein ACN2C6_05265 [Caulobacter sp. ErkDOM-YI]|uniref:hypothetical protein n=1 Tax=unclassified Caulobacter TaxID=2648921 RepID=UPI003AF9F09E